MKERIIAQKILEEVGVKSLKEISLEEIIYSKGIFLKPCKIDGSQGRIVMNGRNAIISFDKSIEYTPKVNFILAHELGHFELHKDLLLKQNFLTDTEKTLNEWYAHGKHEKEANQFAAELLMPYHLFKEQVFRKKFSIDLMRSVASFFGTSITASVLRYRDIGDFPIAIIFSDKKVIKWRSFSEDFLFQYLQVNSPIPENSVAVDYFYDGKLPTEPELIYAQDWFSNDYKIKYHIDMKMYEECLKIHNTESILSVIWYD